MEQSEEAVIDQFLHRFREFCYERVERLSLNEKIQIAYEFLTETNSVPVLQPQASKSVDKAVELKTIGYAEFERKEYAQSFLTFTKSIAFAPANSEELAYAYACRSTLSFEMNRCEQCLLDINRALQENYPENLLKEQLLELKEKCRVAIEASNAAYKRVPRALGIDFMQGRAFLEEIRESFDPDGTEPPPYLRIPSPEIDVKNKIIPNASGKIKVQISSEEKMNIVATAVINPGEILAMEEPFVWRLDQQFIYSRCSYCYDYTGSLIPCPNCSVVMFCSSHCREKAFEKYHRIECQIFSMCPPECEKLSYMTWTSFRAILVATKQGEKLDEMMNHPVYKFPLSISKKRHNVKGQFNSQDYSSVFHHGQFSVAANRFNDYSSGFSLQPLLGVGTWIYLLKHTSFFGSVTEDFKQPLTNRELFVASWLLRSLQCNYRSIQEGYDFQGESAACLKTRRTGYGIFPLMNIFGHSCDPNLELYGYGNNIICRAIRPIKAGEQITYSYVRPYYENPKDDRVSTLLTKYHFECKCKPCVRNWPTKENISSRFSKVVSDTDPKKFDEYADRFLALREANFGILSKPETLVFLCEYLSILDKRFERPCREFIDCSTLLHFCLWTKANGYNSLT